MVRKRKIIVYIATSAEGFIARPDGSVDWLDRPRPKGNYGMGAFYKSIDTVLWGRKTCDIALDFQKKGVTGSAFDTRVKNYVFTRSPLQSSTPAGVEFVSEPIKAFATRVREKKGKDIWMMGGAGIMASFRRRRDRRFYDSRDSHVYRRRHSIDRARPPHRATKTHLLHEVPRRRGQAALHRR
jgi:dihydrofolate reductase